MCVRPSDRPSDRPSVTLIGSAPDLVTKNWVLPLQRDDLRASDKISEGKSIGVNLPTFPGTDFYKKMVLSPLLKGDFTGRRGGGSGKVGE